MRKANQVLFQVQREKRLFVEFLLQVKRRLVQRTGPVLWTRSQVWFVARVPTRRTTRKTG